MQRISVRDAQERLPSLLDDVATGEEFIILRHGKPAARLIAAAPESVQFPDRSKLRASLPPSQECSAQTVRGLRDEERY
ncbi:type II toxin-antitoxin system Phd/YefM family antitoxin [Allohahella sp. A8]|uniref:type II toxin-antitoxin system Phd/YefM family antitoxin n=1 Tax=Allohahella sp. A8 TaxID=3141461 RepID=UPI003A811BC7